MQIFDCVGADTPNSCIVPEPIMFLYNWVYIKFLNSKKYDKRSEGEVLHGHC